MKWIFSPGVFVVTCIITVILSYWLGGFTHPLSKVEFGVLGIFVYVLLFSLKIIFKKVFKGKGNA